MRTRMGARVGPGKSSMGKKGRGPIDGRDTGSARFPLIYLYILLIIVGIALRAWGSMVNPLDRDADNFIAMGDSFLKTGFDFRMPWGDMAHNDFAPTNSHHFSPLFPIYLSMWFAIGGTSVEVARMASLVCSLVAIVVIYWCTRDLYGKRNGLMVTALFSVEPLLITATGSILSENMVLIFFTLTMWAIVRGIKDERYILLAGLFAGLAFLAKASMGYFFLIAGFAGLAWRFYYMRWAVFRSKYYMTGIALFGAIAGGWSLRNLLLFGWPNWETSAYISKAMTEALGQGPGAFLLGLAVMGMFFGAVLARYVSYWHKEIRATVGKVREESVSCLWLSMLLIPATSIFIVSAFSMVETYPAYAYSRLRYLFLVDLPIIWLLANELRDSKHVLRVRVRRWLKEIPDILTLRENGRITKGKVIMMMGAGFAVFVVLVLHSGGSLFMLTLGGFCCVFIKPLKGRLMVAFLISLLVASNAATIYSVPSTTKVGEYLKDHMEPNDTVAFDPPDWYYKYMLYTYFYEGGNPKENITLILYSENCTSHFIISTFENKTYGGNYTFVRKFSSEIISNGVMTESVGSIMRTFGVPIKEKVGVVEPMYLWERTS